MKPEEFLQYIAGFAELTDRPPTKEQWALIRAKLNSVFHKVTPDRSIPLTPESMKNQSYIKTLDLLNEGPICGVNPAGESPLVQPTYCNANLVDGHIIGPSSIHPLINRQIYDSPKIFNVDKTC